MTNEYDLKPCPFCGGKAKFKTTHLDSTLSALVECSDCECRTIPIKWSLDYAAKEKAAELWNRRIENHDA